MFWNIFKSVKLAVSLLITLAIVAIIGTIIPQGEESIEFAMRLKPSTFRIFSILGLFDIYHTLWFRAILALLALNLIVCSLDRIPKTWKRIKSTPPIDMERPFEKVGEENLIQFKGDIISTAKQVEKLLQRQFKTIRSKFSDNKCFFYMEEGRYSHFGVYMVHLSIIMVLIGGIIGSIWGFEGYINILEGEKKNIVRLNRRLKPLKLNFEIRCDKFLVDFYKNGTPKEYVSKLTFIVDGKEVLKKDLRVNHPVHFQGITFYQASYGISLGNKVYIKILDNKTGQYKDIVLKVGEPYPVPEGIIKVVDIRRNLAGAGPAIFLSILPKQGKEKKLVIFKNMERAKKRLPKAMLNAPMFNPSFFKPYTFILEDVEIRYYTGIQVSKDPGVPVVWAGFFMLIIGLMITFFTSHRRIWVRITKKDNMVEIAAAGMSNRDPITLSKRIKRIMEDIRKEVIKSV